MIVGIKGYAGEFVQRHKAARVLKSGNIIAEVMDPNDSDRYNIGPRFSPVANVLRVVVGGKDFLFSPVTHDREFENGGLAMEFDIDSPGGPPGFSRASVGEGFLKIGVGVLEKATDTYMFADKFKIVRLGTTTVDWREDRAEFKQTCVGTRGYAYSIVVNVVLKNSALEISCRLTNTGSEPFSTEQYAHNYFSFSDFPVGPNYEVIFPHAIEPDGMTSDLRFDGRRILYEKTLVHPVNLKIPAPSGQESDASLLVRNSRAGQEIEATTSAATAISARTFLHASSQYLCPEQFIRFYLKPGESADWVRSYVFRTNASQSLP